MKALMLALLLLPVMACFSIGDLSAVEVQVPVNSYVLEHATGVKFSSGTFYMRDPTDNQVLLALHKNGVRFIFPVQEKTRFSCHGRESSLDCLNLSGDGPFTIEKEGARFNAYRENGEWLINLEYEEYPKWLNCNLKLECENYTTPEVIGYNETDVKKVVKGGLLFLRKNRVVELSDKDIEEIVNVSKLGNAGHNGRIVNENGWKPYYKTKHPMLLRNYLTGGCGTGQIIEPPVGTPSFHLSLLDRLWLFLRSLF